jgi:hypothetical protein
MQINNDDMFRVINDEGKGAVILSIKTCNHNLLNRIAELKLLQSWSKAPKLLLIVKILELENIT